MVERLRDTADDQAGPLSYLAAATLQPLDPVETLDDALDPFDPLGPLGSLRPLGAFDTLGPLGALDALGSLRSLDPLRPLGALDALESLRSLHPLGPLGALIALESLRSLHPLGPLGALIALESLRPLDPLRPLGAFGSLRPLGRLQRFGVLGTPGGPTSQRMLARLLRSRSVEPRPRVQEFVSVPLHPLTRQCRVLDVPRRAGRRRVVCTPCGFSLAVHPGLGAWNRVLRDLWPASAIEVRANGLVRLAMAPVEGVCWRCLSFGVGRYPVAPLGHPGRGGSRGQ